MVHTAELTYPNHFKRFNSRSWMYTVHGLFTKPEQDTRINKTVRPHEPILLINLFDFDFNLT